MRTFYVVLVSICCQACVNTEVAERPTVTPQDDGVQQSSIVNLASQTTVTIKHIGLKSTAGVPPSGEGIAPRLGGPGDGTSVVTKVGGWSNGAGAIQWHGGQWILPYHARPGMVLTNMFCIVAPNPNATVLMELVGGTGVIGSNTIPAFDPTQAVFQSWIVPDNGGYTIGDGEQLDVRLTPRNTTTGQYTDASAGVTAITCAFRTIRTSQVMLSPVLFISNINNIPNTTVYNSDWRYNFSPHAMFTTSANGALMLGSVPVHRGDTLLSVTMPVSGIGSVTATPRLLNQSMAQTLLGNVTVNVTDKVTWVPLTVSLGGTVVPDGAGLDLQLSGTATGPLPLWGVDVGMIALTYISGN